MRVASRPMLVAALVGLVAIAAGAAALSQSVSFGSVPGVGSPPPYPNAYGQPAPTPEVVLPAPAPPPPVEAFGTDRSFTFAEDIWLRPGRFVWKPDRRSDGPIGIVIDVRRQMAYVYRAGTLIGVSTVSTGRRGHGTPTGSFPILQKARFHRSNIYSNAPMPFMQRLTWGGVALHAGYNPGYPASHGCIRLPAAFARALYAVTPVGSEVRVVSSLPRIAPRMTLAVSDAPGAIMPRVLAGHLPSTEQSVAVMTAAAL